MQFGNENLKDYMKPLKITLPKDGTVLDIISEIRGTGQPFSYIFIEIDEKPYLLTSVDVNGNWIIPDIDTDDTYSLINGEHKIKATQNQYYRYEYDTVTVNINR